jgi:hypothetical protein
VQLANLRIIKAGVVMKWLPDRWFFLRWKTLFGYPLMTRQIR